jgi:hypothetical protein
VRGVTRSAIRSRSSFVAVGGVALDERFASTRGRLRRRHDAPLVGERAATRACAMEDGDECASAEASILRSRISLAGRRSREIVRACVTPVAGRYRGTGRTTRKSSLFPNGNCFVRGLCPYPDITTWHPAEDNLRSRWRTRTAKRSGPFAKCVQRPALPDDSYHDLS